MRFVALYRLKAAQGRRLARACIAPAPHSEERLLLVFTLGLLLGALAGWMLAP